VCSFVYEPWLQATRMGKKAIVLILVFGLSMPLTAQNFKTQRTEFAITHIGINGLVGGIGALTNKKKGEKGFKVFIKGFGQGCLGGAFQVIGKDLTYQITSREELSYAWAARITSSIGNSITQNAASNINFWERWHFNLGVLRFDYQVKSNDFQARLFPSSIYGIAITARQAKFNLKRTLQTGILVYERDEPVSTLGRVSNGIGIVSSIAVNKNLTGRAYYGLVAHELVHTLQYDNMFWANPFLNRMDEKLKENSTFYQKTSKFLYLDLNGLTIAGLYMAQINRPWECRYIEREADHYSKRVNWPICK